MSQSLRAVRLALGPLTRSWR